MTKIARRMNDKLERKKTKNIDLILEIHLKKYLQHLKKSPSFLILLVVLFVTL